MLLKKVLSYFHPVSKMNSIQGGVHSGKHTYGIENIKLAWQQDQKLTIGAFCSLAGNLNIQLGGNHNSNWATTYPFGHVHKEIWDLPPVDGHPKASRKVEIGNDVWIANNVTLMGGVKIGDGVIVAMNSHVTRSIPPYEVWGGNPAEKIKDRFSEEIKSKLLEIKWWDLPDDLIKDLIPFLVQEPTVESLKRIEKEIIAYKSK